jgi:predicted nucleic acid-binding protein
MSSVTLTPPPQSTTRLVVDTDVASYVFKWHPEFAPGYVDILRGAELVVSFMTLSEMREGALDANWGPRKCDLLETYLRDFSVLHSDTSLCSAWAAIRVESARKGRPISVADAWIAATALTLAVPLVTNNPRDYRQLNDLEILSMSV